MDLETHARLTQKTAIYPNDMPVDAHYQFAGMMYCGLKLAGEAGEVAEKIGKIFRDHNGQVSDEHCEDLVKELGDVYWYLARICGHLGINPTYALEANYEKLMSRKGRGKLGGSGDDR